MYTQPPKASFLGIPSELRVMIIEYVIPTQDLRSRINPYPFASYEGWNLTEYPRDSIPDQFTGWRLDPLCLSILLVNKQCHAEGIHLLYNRVVTVELAQTAFSVVPRSSVHNTVATLYSFEKEGLSRVWGPTLPGLRFSSLQVFEFDIVPFNAQGYWYSIQSALASFCDERLSNGPPLKRFRLKLFDMVRNHWDPSINPRNNRPKPWDAPITARFEDYEATVRVCKRVIQTANQSEIFLPYWMQTHVGAVRLINEWTTYIGAKFHIMPFPTWSKTYDWHEYNFRIPSWATWTEIWGDGMKDEYRHLWNLPEDHKWGNASRRDFIFLADLA